MTAMSDTQLSGVPVLPFIHVDDRGQASLHGSRCGACGVVVLGRPAICPKCTARGQMRPIELAQHGTLYTYTIVHRSFPGVKTPFVAATVDLAGGGTLKGVLEGVAPDPAAIAFDMPVKLVFRATDQHDKGGRPYLAYFFVPALGETQ